MWCTAMANPALTNLPLQLTSFVGREREVAQVKRLLGTTRLLTLTGSGGAGKTRLSLQVAADLLDQFPDGVWLVELASLTDPALVPQAVASVFGIRAVENLALVDALTLYLQWKHLLLLLDNCEHLLDACATLTDSTLRICPHLRVLTTSREPLNLSGEISWRVPSLAVPDPANLSDRNELAEIESVRLFVDRARMVMPDFQLNAGNALAIAQICMRLDGMPLALELAAARVKTLSVIQIAARLSDRFRLLNGGSRKALPRQQTLRATIDWSHNLLSDAERNLFRRLSVFAGGWTLEAAEAVCTGEGIAESEILDLLSRLIDRSLVTVEDSSSSARYRFLETLRQYAHERLVESGDIAQWRERHLMFFLRLAEEAEPELRGADQLQWFGRLEVEHDNIRAALAFALESARGADALRLATALWRFWNVRAYWSEGRQWLTRALAQSPARDQGRAKALNALGMLCWFNEDHLAMQAPVQESLSISRELGDRRGIAGALNSQGMFYGRSGTLRFERDKFEQARPLHAKSLSLRRELGDSWEIAESLAFLGFACRDVGDPASAWELLEESLARWRELGDRWGIAWALLGLGFTAKVQRRYQQAILCFTESFAAAEQLGERRILIESLAQLAQMAEYQDDYALARVWAEKMLKWARATSAPASITRAWMELGQVAYLQGDYGEAVACWKEGLAMSQPPTIARVRPAVLLAYLGYATLALGDVAGALDYFEASLQGQIERSDALAIARDLVAFGGIATAQARDDIALHLFAAAEALAEQVGKPLWRRDSQNPYERVVIFERDLYDRELAALRANLPPSVFAKGWAEGRALTLEEAVAQVDQLATKPSPTPASLESYAGLTAREVELLRLVANGLTNQQIADHLVVSRRTVEAHLRSIFSKLDVTTRGAAAHVALERKII